MKRRGRALVSLCTLALSSKHTHTHIDTHTHRQTVCFCPSLFLPLLPSSSVVVTYLGKLQVREDVANLLDHLDLCFVVKLDKLHLKLCLLSNGLSLGRKNKAQTQSRALKTEGMT